MKNRLGEPALFPVPTVGEARSLPRGTTSPDGIDSGEFVQSKRMRQRLPCVKGAVSEAD